VIINCPVCGKFHNIDNKYAGKTGKCSCGNPIAIPEIEKPKGGEDPAISEYSRQEPQPKVRPIPVPLTQPVRVQLSGNYSHSFGIASLVVGILSFLVCWIPLVNICVSGLGLLLGITGTVLAAKRQGGGAGYSIAGASLNLLSFAASLIFIHAFATIFTPPPKSYHSQSTTEKPQNVVSRLFLVKITKPVLIDLDGSESTCRDPNLLITVGFKNTTDTTKIRYSGTGQKFSHKRASLKDNYGNQYLRIDSGMRGFVGQLDIESIYPGKEIFDVFIFEPPIGGAKTLTLTIPSENLEAEADATITFNASSIAVEK
jgi:hypothetical protein